MIEHALMSSSLMTYNEALMYCMFYEQDGKKDWRMPTFEEIQQIPLVLWTTDDCDYADLNPFFTSLVCPVRDIKE